MAQEIITTQPEMEHIIGDHYMMSPSMFFQQEPSMILQQEPASAMVPLQEGLDIDNTTDSIIEKKTKRAMKHFSSENMREDQINGADDHQGSNAKKLDHNAKERMRRMRLNESFLALRALLPDSRKSKKGRSYPAIVDRVLKYIPEMESEIEKLKQVRDSMQSASKSKQCADDQDLQPHYQGPTVSVTQVKNGEAIIQICTRKDHEGFSNMLQNLEAQGFCIRSTSTLCICDDIVCYQLNVEMNGSSHERDLPNITGNELRDKVRSWLS